MVPKLEADSRHTNPFSASEPPRRAGCCLFAVGPWPGHTGGLCPQRPRSHSVRVQPHARRGVISPVGCAPVGLRLRPSLKDRKECPPETNETSSTGPKMEADMSHQAPVWGGEGGTRQWHQAMACPGFLLRRRARHQEMLAFPLPSA